MKTQRLVKQRSQAMGSTWIEKGYGKIYGTQSYQKQQTIEMKTKLTSLFQTYTTIDVQHNTNEKKKWNENWNGGSYYVNIG